MLLTPPSIILLFLPSADASCESKASAEDDLKWKPPAGAQSTKEKKEEKKQEGVKPPVESQVIETETNNETPVKAKGVGDSAANRESKILRAGLKTIYNTHLKPLEEASCFGDWQSKPLQNSDFDAKPNVLVLGQYSVGKTTSLRYLLGQDFASMRIGPEPTTDNFTVVAYGRDDTIVPGNAAVVQVSRGFTLILDSSCDLNPSPKPDGVVGASPVPWTQCLWDGISE